MPHPIILGPHGWHLLSSGNRYLSLLPVISMNYLHVDLVQECPKLRLCPLVHYILLTLSESPLSGYEIMLIRMGSLGL